MKKCKNKVGYSLMEITITIIIMGVLVSLALPRYNDLTEKVIVGEAIEVVTALKNAQALYEFENPGAYTNDIDTLDITIPASMNYSFTVSDTEPIATATRINTGAWTYSMTITAAGVLSCSSTGTDCAKIGQD